MKPSQEYLNNIKDTYRMRHFIRLFIFIMLAAGIAAGPVGLRADNTPAAAVTDSIPSDSIESDVKLGEVVVKASTVKHSGMKDSYLITKSMREGLHTAGELLSRLNGMFYDHASKEVRFLGSKNIVILVDSVEKDQEYIKRLSHKRFDRIDVISNPTGKYMGYDAVINYHTRPTYEGYEVNAWTQEAFSPDGGNGKGEPFRSGRGGADFTYTNRKLTVAVVADVDILNKNTTTGYSKDYILNGYREYTLKRDKEDPAQRFRRHSYSNNLTLDYKINDNHSLSFLWAITAGDHKIRENQRLVTENTVSGTASTIDYNSLSSLTDNISNSFGLYYRGMANGWYTSASAVYYVSSDNTDRSVDRSDGYSLYDPRHDHFNNVWVGADTQRAFGKRWLVGMSDYMAITSYTQTRRETGLELSHNSVIDNKFFVNAGYFPHPKLSMFLYGGFQLYRNSFDGEAATDVTPRIMAHINYRPSEKFYTRLSYYYSPSLPGIGTITDYGSFTDSLTYQSGNPLLHGETMNQVNLLVSLGGNLNLQARYSRVSDAIYNIAGAGYGDDGRPYVAYRYENGKTDAWYFSIDYNKRFSKYFQINISANVRGYMASYMDYKKRRWLPDAVIGLYYTNAEAGLKGIAGYGLNRTLNITPQSESYCLSDLFSIYVEKYVWKDRLSINLMYQPPIHITRGRNHYSFVSPALIQSGNYSNQYRTNNVIWVGFDFKINGGEKVRKVSLNTYSVAK